MNNKQQITINKKAYQIIENNASLTLNKEFIYFILNLIEFFPTKTADGYIQLSSTYLKSKNVHYNNYINYLKDINMLLCNETYRVSNSHQKGFSKRYKLHPHLENETIEVFIDNKYFTKQIDNQLVRQSLTSNEVLIEKENIDLNRQDNISNRGIVAHSESDTYKDDLLKENLTNILNKLTLDENIYDILNSEQIKQTFGNEYIKKLNEPVYKIINKMNIPTRSINSNRLISNFSRLSSKLRYYFLLDNERLYEVDASNSQFFFLVILIEKENKDIFLNKDADLYKQLCIKGSIYEDLVVKYNSLYPNKKITRDLIKLTTLGAIFSNTLDKNGKENKYRRNTKETFKSLFPSIYNFISEFKLSGRSLSMELQKIESEFIDELSKKMNDIIPVYDCIYIKQSKIDELLLNLTQIFHSKYGIIPNFKKKLLTDINVDCFITKKNEKEKIEYKLKHNTWL